MRTRGFTLIEMASVAIILTITSAVLAPVVEKSRLESKAASARTNLHGFWKGLVLYQGDHDGGEMPSTPKVNSVMADNNAWLGFVNQYTGNYDRGWATKKTFTPCGTDSTEEFKGLGIGYMPAITENWKKDVEKFGDQSVILFDKNCNLQGTRILCQLCDKRSIGVTLNGSLRDRKNSNWTVLNQNFYR